MFKYHIFKNFLDKMLTMGKINVKEFIAKEQWEEFC